MKTILQSTALAMIIGLTGCGQGGDDAAAVRASAPKQVTKWKHHPKSAVGGQKGIVIETQDGKLTSATLYDLKDGEGFAIYSTIGKGSYNPGKGQIVFSNTGNIQLSAQEAAQVNDAIRWEVPFQSSATNLVATFILDGKNMGALEFLPFKE
jgi:predicted small lipoprotein YifL